MKRILFFAGLLCVGAFANVDAVEATQNDSYVTSVELSQGYRRDSLKLRLGSHKQNFKHVNEYTTRIGATVVKDDFFLKAIAGYGDVRSGKVHNGNHSSNHHKVNGDYTADFSLTFGKEMRMQDGWNWAPTLGYGVYVQDFHTKHHKERVKGTWYSPQLGIGVQKVFSDTLNAYACYKFLFPLNFQATVHHSSNKGTHENKAYKSLGNIGTIGLEWTFADNWSLRPEIEGMKFYSKRANSHHHHSKDTERASVEYRLVLGYMF